MRPGDAGRCVELVASHPEERRRYGLLLKHLQPAWVKLIRSGAMKPILIEDTGGRAPEMCKFLRRRRMTLKGAVRRVLDRVAAFSAG